MKRDIRPIRNFSNSSQQLLGRYNPWFSYFIPRWSPSPTPIIRKHAPFAWKHISIFLTISWNKSLI